MQRIYIMDATGHTTLLTKPELQTEEPEGRVVAVEEAKRIIAEHVKNGYAVAQGRSAQDTSILGRGQEIAQDAPLTMLVPQICGG